MKANYGYTDGSGAFYVTIDTDRCDGCDGREGGPACLEACPEKIFRVEEDDYDELMAVVVEEHRKKIKYTCGPCKPVGESVTEPCHAACPHDAITHSW